MMLIVSFLDTLKNNDILAKKVLIYFLNFGHHLFKFRCLPSLKNRLHNTYYVNVLLWKC